MPRPLLALLILAAACGNNDNLIVGGASAGETTPDIFFDGVGSSIHGITNLRDAAGNKAAGQSAVVIMSNLPNLCDRLKAHPDYFRNPPEAYEALIMIVPVGQSTPDCPPASGVRVGTFVVGRHCDEGTQAEIVAVSGPQTPTPFIAEFGSFIAVTDFPENGGNASGNFSLGLDDPYGSGIAHLFSGRFKTNLCPAIADTLLP